MLHDVAARPGNKETENPMKIQTTLDIDAPASAVWHLLGEQFDDVAEWSATINKSSLDRPLGEGAVRTCDLKAFGPVPAGQVTEELTRFDRGSRSLTYVVRSGVPGFMRFVENAWTVEALDEIRSRVTSRATFNWRGGCFPFLHYSGCSWRGDYAHSWESSRQP